MKRQNFRQWIHVYPKIQDCNETPSTAITKRFRGFFQGLGERPILVLLKWNSGKFKSYKRPTQTPKFFFITLFVKNPPRSKNLSSHSQIVKSNIFGWSLESFKTTWKSLQSDFLEAQIICKCRMVLICCSMNSLEPKLHSDNLFDMDKTRQKNFGWL